jgi:hypothetical protein
LTAAIRLQKAIVEADWTGPSFQTCMNCSSVARKFETSRRREVLSFRHRAEASSLNSDEADALLDAAASNVWSASCRLRRRGGIIAQVEPSGEWRGGHLQRRHRAAAARIDRGCFFGGVRALAGASAVTEQARGQAALRRAPAEPEVFGFGEPEPRPFARAFIEGAVEVYDEVVDRL